MQGFEEENDYTLGFCTSDIWSRKNAYESLLVLKSRLQFEIELLSNQISTLEESTQSSPKSSNDDDWYGVINGPFEFVLGPKEEQKLKSQLETLVYNINE